MRDSDFLKLARARFTQAEEADKAQRQREQEDLQFYAGDQWPADVVAARMGQGPASSGDQAAIGLPPVPARPMLTINKLREPIHQVLNQERQSDYSFELVPADDWGGLAQPIDPTEIEVREGLVRRIQRQSEASDARTWAFNRAVIAGRGYYRVISRYVSDRSSDQELALERIFNQASVSLDPAHEQPDGSDAEWAFVGVDMPLDQYVSEFGRRADGSKNPVAHASDQEWRAFGDDAPGWFTEDTQKQTRFVRVVDYYYTDRTPIEVTHLANGRAVPTDELPKDAVVARDADGQPERRMVSQKTIKIAKIDGAQILDETEWVAPFMPIIKILGEELQPFGKERRSEGMVRPGRSSQEGFNYMVSKMVETVGLAPIPPWQIAEGQIEGYEAWYEAANTRALPYLPYKQSDLEGRPAGAPTRTPVDTPIAAIAGSLQVFNESIKSTTGIPDPTLGNIDPSIRSGKAIKQLLDQAQRGSSNYLDNLARSIRYEAKVINAALPVVYGRPGRMAQLVNGEGDPTSVLLHQPFIMQGPGGQQKPVPAPPGHPQAKTYTLTKGADFNIAVKVTKSYDTRREEEASQVGDLIASEPQLMTWFGDLFFENQDGPGHEEMAKRAKLMLAPPIQQAMQGQAQIPPQVQQQMGQAQQMIDLLTKELQEKTQVIQTDQIKHQADLQKAAMDNQTRIEIARINQEGAFAVADLKASVEAARTAIQEMQELRQVFETTQAHVHAAAEQGRDHAHELRMAQVGQQHALEQANQQHAQALEQGMQDHAAALEQGEQGHEQALAQGAQQAALRPTPQEGASA